MNVIFRVEGQMLFPEPNNSLEQGSTFEANNLLAHNRSPKKRQKRRADYV